MKVKCVKTKIEDPDNIMINADMDDYIQIGEEFIVYGIYCEKDIKIYAVLWQDKLIYLPSELFEIIDSKAPDIWKIRIYENGGILIVPEEFFNEYFFDRFSDRNDVEVEQFERIRHLCE